MTTLRSRHLALAKSSALASDDEPTKRLIAFATRARDVDDGAEEEEDDHLREKLLAEFVGTFFLVLTVGVAVHSGGILAPLAIGGMLGIQIYTFASVSGGMFNPAVTLAVLLSGRGKIKPLEAGLYIAVQILAGIIAGLIALGITDESFCFDYALLSNGSWGTSLVLEIIFTMCLCNIVLSSGTSFDAPNQYFGVAIGGSVTAAAIACGGWDQGSFNPAVTIGINIANYAKEGSVGPSGGAWALFIIAPLLGGVVAAGVFRATRAREYLSVKKLEAAGSAHLLREKLLAEVIGTAMLALTVCIAVAGGSALAPIAIGGILGVQIYTFGSVSGGLFNPAVTVSIFLSGRKKLKSNEAALFCAVQLAGGLIGALIGFGVTEESFAFDWGLASTGPNWGTGFLLEVFYTSALCSIVLSAGTSFEAPNQYFGFAIGGSVTAAAAACGKFDQGSFNPAVTYGVNIANYANGSRSLEPHGEYWVMYMLAPVLGGVLSAGIFRGTRHSEYPTQMSKGAGAEQLEELQIKIPEVGTESM